MTKVGEHITLDIIGTKREYDSAFFEKLGYRLEKTQADFWGKGLHLHQVVKSIG